MNRVYFIITISIHFSGNLVLRLNKLRNSSYRFKYKQLCLSID